MQALNCKISFTKTVATKEKLSTPLLVSASSANENAPDKRVLTIGQETLGWGSCESNFWNYKEFAAAENGIAALLAAYSKFVCKSRQGNTPFWKGLQTVAGVKSNAENSNVPVLWSNPMATDFEKSSHCGNIQHMRESVDGGKLDNAFLYMLIL